MCPRTVNSPTEEGGGGSGGGQDKTKSDKWRSRGWEEPRGSQEQEEPGNVDDTKDKGKAVVTSF